MTGYDDDDDGDGVTGNDNDVDGDGATGDNVDDVNGNGAMEYDDDDGDGMTDDDVDDDCNGATDNDVLHDGRRRLRDIDGGGATGNNNNDDGDLGLGARPLLQSSLPTHWPVGG